MKVLDGLMNLSFLGLKMLKFDASGEFVDESKGLHPPTCVNVQFHGNLQPVAPALVGSNLAHLVFAKGIKRGCTTQTSSYREISFH